MSDGRNDPIGAARAAGKTIPELPEEEGTRIAEPWHYSLGAFEVADVQEAFLSRTAMTPGASHHVAMVLRYCLRAGRKKGPGNARKDLEKAAWHLQRAIGLL